MHEMQQLRSSAITVLVAESSHLNCELLVTAFRRMKRDLEFIGCAVEPDRVLALAEKHRPNVAVISAQLESGPLDGYRVLTQLRSLETSTRAILLLDSRERDLVIDAFRCGAHGVIFRDERIETLGRCIHAVHQGQVWANSEQLRYLLDELCRLMPLNLKEKAQPALLSKRQDEVARLVSQGLTNRDVAAKLGLSEHTIRNYLFQIFDRVGVSTRVELVLYYLHHTQRPTGN